MSKQHMEKVQMYFEAALAVDPHKRNEFLAELCGKETGLYNEVKDLLDADSHSNDLWSDLTRLKTPVKQKQEYQPGDTIGPHQIVNKIGAGGMGIIYKALDSRLDRNVALKFLPHSINSDEVVRQRFLAEARAASQLDHPNICVIHDIGETPEGNLFITMPYYEGETLATRINRGPLPLDEAINTALHIASGLATAHEHNIVHRDIKPANIMLTQDGGIRILDFGIAKVENIHLTSTGMSVGTLAYMSPEQLYGQDVDARSDIWSLGVVFFEMISGEKAFPGKAMPDILQSVLHNADKIYHNLAVDIPESVLLILQTAMSREIEERYTSMMEMLDALELAHSEFVKHDATRPGRAHIPSGKKARSYQWDELVLEVISSILVSHLGPITSTLVKRTAQTSSDINDLRNQLAEHLPDQQSRDDFFRQMETRVAVLTTPPVPRALKTDGSLAGVELSTVQLAELEKALIPFLGPIAQTMIKRTAANVSTMEELRDALLERLDNVNEKNLFIQETHTLFSS